MPSVSPGAGRPTSASRALAAGGDLKVVPERLGHSQPAITADLYAHVNRRLGKAAAQHIADTLRAPAETFPVAFLPQPLETHSDEGIADP